MKILLFDFSSFAFVYSLSPLINQMILFGGTFIIFSFRQKLLAPYQ